MKAKSAIFVVCLFIVVFLCLGTLFWVMYPIKYKQEILQYSSQYNLSANLVASIICVESRYNPEAKSSSGACGLMQIMPTTFSWICSNLGLSENQNIFEPKINIQAGCYYLNYLFDKYKNQTFVLACYNAGEGTVLGWGNPTSFVIENIQYTETRQYVNKVLNLLHLYSSRLD